MKWKNYRTGDVLDFNSSNGIFHACNVSIEDNKTESNHPYVVRTSHNNGIRGYISEDESKLNPANTISFAQDTAQMFYQSEPYFTGNKVKVLSVKGHVLTENIAMFLITCMNKAFSNFAWGSSYDTKLLQNVMLLLPVKTKYIPDFNLMSEIIGGGISMSNVDTSSWKEFLITDLFELCPVKSKLTKLDLCNTGAVPVYSSETSNNGINGYTDVAAQFIVDEKTPLYLVFGDHTRSMNIVDESFCVMDNVKVLKPKYSVSAEALLYISTVWKKAIPDLGYARHWSVAKDLSIKLPVKESEEIDWKFMEKYIHAIEKIVIKDVVDYKDSIIAKTKEIVV